MRNQALSDNELAILQVLWDSGRALSRPEILDRIENTSWNPNSIHMVLNNLMRKGYVQIDSVTRCGQGYGRTYSATKTQGAYIADLALHAIPGTSEETCIVEVMTAMVNRFQISEATIDHLKEMLERRREELRKKAK